MADQKKTPGSGNRTRGQQYQCTRCTSPCSFPQDIVAAFKAALDKAGLSTNDKITVDGRLHRFTIQGDRLGSRNGWYVLFDGLVPAGAFGSWKTGQTFKWCAKSQNTLTVAERHELAQRMKAAQRARQAEEQARHKAAADKAKTIWTGATPAPADHPYLTRKGVRNHGLHLFKGALVVPLCDPAGNLHSLQFIAPDGSKRFLSGGRIQGCFFMIGTPVDTLCIAEGYATAASIYEATGHAVAVAFNCGNLKSVALTLRSQYPHAHIVICADNDVHTPGNPGLTKAREAATAVRGYLATPPIDGDFNDLVSGEKK